MEPKEKKPKRPPAQLESKTSAYVVVLTSEPERCTVRVISTTRGPVRLRSPVLHIHHQNVIAFDSHDHKWESSTQYERYTLSFPSTQDLVFSLNRVPFTVPPQTGPTFSALIEFIPDLDPTFISGPCLAFYPLGIPGHLRDACVETVLTSASGVFRVRKPISFLCVPLFSSSAPPSPPHSTPSAPPPPPQHELGRVPTFSLSIPDETKKKEEEVDRLEFEVEHGKVFQFRVIPKEQERKAGRRRNVEDDKLMTKWEMRLGKECNTLLRFDNLQVASRGALKDTRVQRILYFHNDPRLLLHSSFTFSLVPSFSGSSPHLINYEPRFVSLTPAFPSTPSSSTSTPSTSSSLFSSSTTVTTSSSPQPASSPQLSSSSVMNLRSLDQKSSQNLDAFSRSSPLPVPSPRLPLDQKPSSHSDPLVLLSTSTLYSSTDKPSSRSVSTFDGERQDCLSSSSSSSSYHPLHYLSSHYPHHPSLQPHNHHPYPFPYPYYPHYPPHSQHNPFHFTHPFPFPPHRGQPDQDQDLKQDEDYLQDERPQLQLSYHHPPRHTQPHPSFPTSHFPHLSRSTPQPLQPQIEPQSAFDHDEEEEEDQELFNLAAMVLSSKRFQRPSSSSSSPSSALDELAPPTKKHNTRKQNRHRA